MAHTEAHRDGTFAAIHEHYPADPSLVAQVVWADAGLFALGDDFGNPGCDECGTYDAVVKINGSYLCEGSLGEPEHALALEAWRLAADPNDADAFCDECGAAVNGWTGISACHETSCSLHPANLDEVATELATVAPRPGAAVPAEARDDHYAHSVHFDATPYLAQVSAADIKALMACGWHGDYPADDVARFFEGKLPELDAMFAYIRSDHTRPGFEVALDAEAAGGWLAEHRPEVWAAAIAALGVSSDLLRFFSVELRDEEEMRRQRMDPPASTIGSALASWAQAPAGVRASWLELSRASSAPGKAIKLAQVTRELEALGVTLGEDYELRPLCLGW